MSSRGKLLRGCTALNFSTCGFVFAVDIITHTWNWASWVLLALFIVLFVFNTITED